MLIKMEQKQVRKYKNSPEVRSILAKLRREQRARAKKKLEESKASVTRLDSKDTLAVTAGAVTTNE